MSLSEVSIRRPVFAWMLMAGLILFGWISFMRMGVSLLPDVDFPVVTVSVTLPGAAPQVMETDVVDIVEDAAMSIQGVKNVSSTSRNSAANISIEFDINRDIDLALQDVQAKLAQVQKNLPREMDPPTISKTNPEDQPIIWLAVSSDHHSLREMMVYVRDVLKNEFATVAGVGEVFLGGYVEPNMRVWVSDTQLRQYSLTVGDIVSTIQNEHSEPPAGQIQTGPKEFNVRTLGEANNLEEFSKISIIQRGGAPNYSPIQLRQVAKIEEGLADIRRLSRANGKPAVGLGIRKQRGVNAVQVAREVKAKMESVKKILPKGMEIAVNFDSTKFIEESVHELNFTLLLSALLTGLVCWVFLGSWSSTINVLMAIPTSIIGAFSALYFFGFTLNTFTLLALSLAIGIVVDDAIMVLENIIRHKEMGKSRMEAALSGSKEISFAAMAATVSIVAIFVPIAFMPGVMGKYFYQFAITMTVAVLISLLEALTLTPMRCSQFLDSGERTSWIGRTFESWMGKTHKFYERTLAIALQRRWTVIIVSFLFFGLSLFFFKLLNKEFAPPEDQSRFMMRVQAPVGSSLQFTDEKFKEVETFLSTRPEIHRFFGAIGGLGGGEVNSGILFVSMKPKGSRGVDPATGKELSQFDLMGLCRKTLNQIKDIKVTVQDLSMRGFTSSRGFPIEFTIQGPEWEELARYSHQIMDEMKKTNLMTDIDTNYQVGMPEIQIIPDRQQALQHGVSISSIGQTINALIGGVVVGRYAKGGHRYDIRVKLQDSTQTQMERIRGIFVRNNRGELIPISSVVKIQQNPTLQFIARQNRERAVSIFANVAKGQSQQMAMEKSEEIARRVLPDGYYLKQSGTAQTFKESMNGLLFAFWLGIVVAYMILASQFNSFKHPWTVLLALPFSISGAFIALWIGQQSINIYSMIGIVLLMGIVKKNSILLVDFTNQVREQNPSKPVTEALQTACPTRLRPILMTSIATIVGAIPPALAIGPGAESRIPMAIAVIGGVLISTMLTLYVVPVAYKLFHPRTR
jgi:hydrophobe/amphiphile efflux-1 (HAE1) family protein